MPKDTGEWVQEALERIEHGALARLELKQDRMLAELGELQREMGGTSIQLSEMGKTLEQVRCDVQDHGERIDSLEAREARRDGHEEGAALPDRVKAVEAKVGALERIRDRLWGAAKILGAGSVLGGGGFGAAKLIEMLLGG